MMNCCVTSLGHCDLDIDLVSTIGIISYILLSKEFQIWCVYASWDGGVSHTIFGSRSHCNSSFGSFGPSQQFFSHVETGLPKLNQY